MADDKPQADKFKEAARELGCDEDEAAWDERLKKVVRPSPESPPTGDA
jgi:hypothetical protein